MRQQSNYVRGSINGRPALSIAFTNRNEATGRDEIVTIYTAQLRNGGLFYMITVAPRDEFNVYSRVFQNIVNSVRLNA